MSQPQFGSVERYAEILRENSLGQHDERHAVYVSAFGLISAVSDGTYGTDSEQLARVRNAVAATRQVLEELR